MTFTQKFVPKLLVNLQWYTEKLQFKQLSTKLSNKLVTGNA